MRRSLAFALAVSACLSIPAHAEQSFPVPTVMLTLSGANVDVRQPPGEPPALTDDELRALGSELLECWKISALALREISFQSTDIKVVLDNKGNPTKPFSVVTPPPAGDGAGAAFRDSAVRTLSRCMPLKLPEAKYARWKEILVRFSPLERPGQPNTELEREVYVRSPTWRNVTEAVTVQLGDKLTACWRRNDPAATLDKIPRITMQFELKRDGNVAKAPVFYDEDPGSPSLKVPAGPARNEAVKRASAAIYRCAPYSFLPKVTYDLWNTVIADF